MDAICSPPPAARPAKTRAEIELALAGGQALPRDSLQYLQLGLVVRRPDVLHARPPAPEEYTTCTIVAPDAVFTARAYGTRPHYGPD